MPIDPSIPLSVKPVEIPNRLDVAIKGLTLRNLTAQSEEHELEMVQKRRAVEDDTALRDAYKQNTTVGPDGTPMVNPDGVASTLAQGGRGQMAMSVKLGAQKQKLDQISQLHQASEEILSPLGTKSTQEDYDKAEAQAKQFGLPSLKAKLGPDFDPDPASNFQIGLNNLKKQSLDAKSQIALKNKEVDQEIARTGQALKLAEMRQQHEHFVLGKQQEANQSFASSVEASRQRPDVKTALTDTLQAKKFNELLAPYADDLDKAPLQVMRNAVTEATKMSKGGVAGEGETAENIPDTRKQKLAMFVQNVIKGGPAPANAGEQLKLYRDYVNGLDSIARSTVNSAYNENLEQHANYMSPGQVETAKNIGAKRFIEGESAKRAQESSKTKSKDYPIGATGKTKDGTSVIYQGNGKWVATKQ